MVHLWHMCLEPRFTRSELFVIVPSLGLVVVVVLRAVGHVKVVVDVY